jgi:hypothetical protein
MTKSICLQMFWIMPSTARELWNYMRNSLSNINPGGKWSSSNEIGSIWTIFKVILCTFQFWCNFKGGWSCSILKMMRIILKSWKTLKLNTYDQILYGYSIHFMVFYSLYMSINNCLSWKRFSYLNSSKILIHLSFCLNNGPHEMITLFQRFSLIR